MRVNTFAVFPYHDREASLPQSRRSPSPDLSSGSDEFI